ncbi:MAG: hypothetical protein AB1545_01030 [Thermodesulfobacteriota bacterium]
MNFEVNVDHSRKIIYMRFADTVNYEALLAFITALMQHPEFNEQYNGICDTRGSLLALSHDDLIRFRAWLEMRDARLLGRWAILADSNMNFGTSRMWEALSAGYHKGLQVFKNEQEAYDWLHAGS